jgi:putative ABC transport system permease protein
MARRLGATGPFSERARKEYDPDEVKPHNSVWLRPRRVPFATRSLLRDRVRLLISLGGIGFAMLLVLLLDGIRVGTVAKSTTYIDHVGADVFVAREGVTNMALAASVLPEELVQEIAAVDGVQEASGILRIPVIVSAGQEKRPATLIGYEAGAPLGGPWQIVDGRAVGAEDETVVDQALAGELGLRLGDQLELSGTAFTVVGLSGQTANIAGKHVFLARPSVLRLVGASGIVSFVLVRIEQDAGATQVAEEIDREVPGVTATTRRDLSENDRALLGSLFTAPINVMSTVGLLVGLAIIGLTMYTTTSERLRDFGVLKALGAGHWFLLRTVVTQAIVLGLLGFLVGIAAAQIAGPFIVRLVPDIGVTLRLTTALLTLAAALAMSLLGAVLPMVRIIRVDPLLVFRS